MDSQIRELHQLLIGSRLKKEVIAIIASIYNNKIFTEFKTQPANQDFVVGFEALIDDVLLNLSKLLTNGKFDKYKLGQLVSSLLHDHILNRDSQEKQQSIESQIDNFEYDICQSAVVRLFGLLSNDNLCRVVFTIINETKSHLNNYLYQNGRRSSGQGTRAGLSLGDIIHSSSSTHHREPHVRTTSALYTLVIAMLTTAVFMPIVDTISEPKFLLAVIIWLCKREERERLKREEAMRRARDKPSPAREAKSKQPMTSNSNYMTPSTSIVVTNPRGVRSIDLEEGYDFGSSNINFVAPICGSLKRPLENIEIFDTEEVRGNNSCYVLYCIRYDGLCYRHPSAGGYNFIPDNSNVPIIDKRQTHSIRRKNNNGVESTSYINTQPQSDVPNRKSFRRRMVVKRRFREFVLLQLRLEENPKTRIFMGKNIPKPTRLRAATQSLTQILSLSSGNNVKLDQSTIRTRQRFLERFLIALNNSPFISNSYEFKEFFSYNVNPVEMSKSKSTILQAVVKSAFTMIRSTLPGDDYHSLRASSNQDPDAWLTELQQSTMKLHIQTRTSHSRMSLEKLIDAKLSSLDDSPKKVSTKSSSLGRYYQEKRQQPTSGPFEWMGGSRGGSLKACMSSSSISSSAMISRSSSSYSNSQNVDTTSKSASNETIYYEASNEMVDEEAENNSQAPSGDSSNSIQICDNFPIASKLIDIMHFSISKNPACSSSPFNFVARFLLGRIIERQVVKLLETLVTLDAAAFCLDGIASSVWDEDEDDPPLDIEHASLDEAVEHLTTLIEHKYASYTFIPKQLLKSLLSKQLRFYLIQLDSQQRNKFVIYSFFNSILDHLEFD